MRIAMALLFMGFAPFARAELPAWLPHYDLDITIEVDQHRVIGRETVTWTNRHARPAGELTFNAHSHFQVPKSGVALNAKTLEILRMTPSDCMEGSDVPPPLQVRSVMLGTERLDYRFEVPIWQESASRAHKHHEPKPREEPEEEAKRATALVVPLSHPVTQGETVTVVIEFELRLPQKQGRWGQWQGITFLANWLPVLAYYDEAGWQPTPFIPWHQPFFNEAGIYTGRFTVPCAQQIACSTSLAAVRDLGNGYKQVDLTPVCVRDFAFLCSSAYREFTGEVAGVQVRCYALPEHEHYARAMVQWACEAIPVYNRWIGPYPYSHFTIAESFFGWNGNECGGLVMIDSRIFGMPHVAEGFVEYLISHELCHQWWYNAIGTNGYCETWMDEAMATHLSHRLITCKHGRENNLLALPRGLGWIPNIRREDYRIVGLYGTLGRGEAGPTVQEMPEFEHLVNLLTLCYDRGSKIVAMIEERLGEASFFEFQHVVYSKYQFRILRVADFQRELEAFTGRSWEDFFRDWLYGAGMTDWCIEKVKITPVKNDVGGPSCATSFLDALRGHGHKCRPCKATVLLHQKAELNEATVLGFAFDGSDNYSLRVPIQPGLQALDLPDPPAHVETLPGNRVRVEVELPATPTQITVDPDQVLVDANPANNYWKSPIRTRFSPVYTPLEETDYTNYYDRWNVLYGIGVFGPAYTDPWYDRSPVVGARAALFRTQEFQGGVYAGYRTDFRDIVAGVDGLWEHWPWHSTQVGFNIERSLTTMGSDDDQHSNRGVLFGRYVINGQYSSSLYLPPMHFVEVFGTIQDHSLPQPRQQFPDANHFDHQTGVGVHYHIDYLTPYWDPEGGFRFDATYGAGIPLFGENVSFHRIDAQISTIYSPPDWCGPLADTKLAVRLYGAAGLPDQGEYFTMGGAELFRGFDLKERQGNAVWIASLEWRIPIVRHVNWDVCDHVAGIRNIYVAPFYDVGDTYLLNHSLGPVAHAVGAGLRVDVAWLSLIERTNLRFDFAKAVNTTAPWQFWFGIQVPF